MFWVPRSDEQPGNPRSLAPKTCRPGTAPVPGRQRVLTDAAQPDLVAPRNLAGRGEPICRSERPEALRFLAGSGQSALPGRWVDTDERKAIAQYAARRDRLETALADAVRVARSNGRSWSQIGTMLGVSKQAAQRNYSKLVS